MMRPNVVRAASTAPSISSGEDNAAIQGVDEVSPARTGCVALAVQVGRAPDIGELEARPDLPRQNAAARGARLP